MIALLHCLQWSSVAISGWQFSNSFFQALTMFQIAYATFWEINYFIPTHYFSTHVENLSLVFRYFTGKCSDKLTSFVPSVHTFTAKTFHATSTKSNHPHSLSILFVRGKFYSRALGLWKRHSRG